MVVVGALSTRQFRDELKEEGQYVRPACCLVIVGVLWSSYRAFIEETVFQPRVEQDYYTSFRLVGMGQLVRSLADG